MGAGAEVIRCRRDLLSRWASGVVGPVGCRWPWCPVVPLVAPASVSLTPANDPDHHRTGAWLFDELLGDDRHAPAGHSIESAPSTVTDR